MHRNPKTMIWLALGGILLTACVGPAPTSTARRPGATSSTSSLTPTASATATPAHPPATPSPAASHPPATPNPTATRPTEPLPTPKVPTEAGDIIDAVMLAGRPRVHGE